MLFATGCWDMMLAVTHKWKLHVGVFEHLHGGIGQAVNDVSYEFLRRSHRFDIV